MEMTGFLVNLIKDGSTLSYRKFKRCFELHLRKVNNQASSVIFK